MSEQDFYFGGGSPHDIMAKVLYCDLEVSSSSGHANIHF